MRTPVHTANGRRDLALPGVAQAIESTRGPEGCDVTLPEGVWPGRTRHRHWLSWPIALASGVLALMMGGVLVDRMMERHLATELPDVPPISILNALADQTPVSATITADWQKVNVTVPTYALRSDVTLWRRMNFDDWDTVTERVREDGLSAMWKRFSFLVNKPAQWDRMNAHDWDWIANVKRLRRRYIRNEDSSPAWHFLFDRARNEELATTAAGATNGRERAAGHHQDTNRE